MSKAVLSTSKTVSPVPYLMALVFLISILNAYMGDDQKQRDFSSMISSWWIGSIGKELASHQSKDINHVLRCWCNPPWHSYVAVHDKYYIISFLFLQLPMHSSVLSSSENLFCGRTLCLYHSNQIFLACQKQMRIMAWCQHNSGRRGLWRFPTLT